MSSLNGLRLTELLYREVSVIFRSKSFCRTNWKISSDLVFTLTTENGFSPNSLCDKGRDICFFTMYGINSPLSVEYLSFCEKKNNIYIQNCALSRFGWLRFTYGTQELNDPFIDDVNMRIDHSTVHVDVSIAMQQMIRQIECLFEVTGRCKKCQSLRIRLHANQITFCGRKYFTNFLT